MVSQITRGRRRGEQRQPTVQTLETERAPAIEEDEEETKTAAMVESISSVEIIIIIIVILISPVQTLVLKIKK